MNITTTHQSAAAKSDRVLVAPVTTPDGSDSPADAEQQYANGRDWAIDLMKEGWKVDSPVYADFKDAFSRDDILGGWWGQGFNDTVRAAA